eukprot:11183829-Lingulodinium_polyedra.AAC.1
MGQGGRGRQGAPRPLPAGGPPGSGLLPGENGRGGRWPAPAQVAAPAPGGPRAHSGAAQLDLQAAA